MNAPGKGLLKTTSILFIIFGALFTLIAALSINSAIAMSSPGFASQLPPGVDPRLFDSKTMLVTSGLLLAGSVLDVVFGILGVKKCGDPVKEHFFFTAGVILSGLSVISLYAGIITTGFNVTSLISFVLPALFIIGSVRNKKALVSAR